MSFINALKETKFLLVIFFLFVFLTCYKRPFLYAENLPSFNVMINNELQDMGTHNEILVKNEDAVRIGGFTEPGEKIDLKFRDSELTAIANKNGDWFVLFSILNLEEGRYPVKASFGNSQEKLLTTLVIGEDNLEKTRPSDESENQDQVGLDNDVKEKNSGESNSPILLILSVIVSFALGFLFRTFLKKTELSKKTE